MTDPTSSSSAKDAASPATTPQFHYIQYDGTKENEYVPAMRQLISKDLSEPYSIYVYRYFLYQWGDLCYMVGFCEFSIVLLERRRRANQRDPSILQAMDQNNNLAGVVVSKLERHRNVPLRGYIAMLAVREEYRGRGIATKLVCMAIDAMIERNADEIVLETETTNHPAMKLYERLGFLRSKQLHRYYLNGSSAFRLVLYLKEGVGMPDMYGCAAHIPPAPAQPGDDDNSDGLASHENGECPARHIV
ncbi:N-alpha-acetyltransferase 30 [Emydomyces testavorans]|uniref:N-alpha-acetyltransferase 30 n=1 Tax=Emydomyces testavorans TaxID=2070801 RepID=A0AAF0IK09_9EURO|nr:N-alpha-acetyltransferase 30 [Emydomyces testavorans]